jgi:hypothetical protein
MKHVNASYRVSSASRASSAGHRLHVEFSQRTAALQVVVAGRRSPWRPVHCPPVSTGATRPRISEPTSSSIWHAILPRAAGALHLCISAVAHIILHLSRALTVALASGLASSRALRSFLPSVPPRPPAGPPPGPPVPRGVAWARVMPGTFMVVNYDLTNHERTRPSACRRTYFSQFFGSSETALQRALSTRSALGCSRGTQSSRRWRAGCSRPGAGPDGAESGTAARLPVSSSPAQKTPSAIILR